jgi:hypothetical protein
MTEKEQEQYVSPIGMSWQEHKKKLRADWSPEEVARYDRNLKRTLAAVDKREQQRAECRKLAAAHPAAAT